MFSRRQRTLLLAFFVFMSMVNLIDRADALSGSVRVTTDLELYGVGGMAGGGHLTWALTGDQALILRAKILGMYDGYTRIPRGFAYAGNATSTQVGTQG